MHQPSRGHVYNAAKQAETIAWCNANGVLVNGYSPFGVPDHRTYAPPQSKTILADPVVRAIAAAHASTPAQVLLAWHYQLGVVFNPRSMNAAHVLENLGLTATPWWSLKLTDAEMQQLNARPQ